jgi:hypothetical protein
VCLDFGFWIYDFVGRVLASKMVHSTVRHFLLQIVARLVIYFCNPLIDFSLLQFVDRLVIPRFIARLVIYFCKPLIDFSLFLFADRFLVFCNFRRRPVLLLSVKGRRQDPLRVVRHQLCPLPQRPDPHEGKASRAKG